MALLHCRIVYSQLSFRFWKNKQKTHLSDFGKKEKTQNATYISALHAHVHQTRAIPKQCIDERIFGQKERDAAQFRKSSTGSEARDTPPKTRAMFDGYVLQQSHGFKGEPFTHATHTRESALVQNAQEFECVKFQSARKLWEIAHLSKLQNAAG